MSGPSEITCLVEDVHHKSFVREYLRRLGYSPRVIRFDALSAGKGSGEQRVRERYADLVKAFRRRAARARTVMVVAIDADVGEVDARMEQFRTSLRKARIEQRADNEALVHLVPKRHIETWVLCLSGSNVDEQSDYKRHAGRVTDKIKPAVETLYDWSRNNATVPANCIPSLAQAIVELKRLPPA